MRGRSRTSMVLSYNSDTGTTATRKYHTNMYRTLYEHKLFTLFWFARYIIML